MQRIADWLKTLGMSEYAERFAESDIDIDVLSELTDHDFDRLGVSLGHRRKMLRAIRELSASPIAASTERQASAPTVPDPAPRDTAERRQVTVMFSDLVGSTALSARMDPEDLREVISSYQKCVAATVQRFGGFVAKYMGDGVLVYFGYPQAHEDDAERALRAGLELVAAVSGLKTHTVLQTRVGIATGLVVVGDLIGSGASQEQAIVGETPNLAARLQGVAEPNSVVIAESTRKLLGNLFELQDLGAQDLKGIAGAVRAWAALRATSVEGRFEAMHATGLTALVGRERRTRTAAAALGEGEDRRRPSSIALRGGRDWQIAIDGSAAGAPRRGATYALTVFLFAAAHRQCAFSGNRPDGARSWVCSRRHDGCEAGQARRGARANLDLQEDTALFAEMLSMANDGRYPALDLAPQQRRQKTFHALGSQIEALTRTNPVLMILEDAHWGDPTSLEAFGRAVEQIAQLRVLLIVTYRPEFAAPWIGRPHVSTLTLNRLGQREIAAMIDGLAGNKALPTAIRQDIMERTDGIPLFVEEMTKAVLEAKSLAAAAEAVAMVPQPALAVPASLHASLMARLDRLGASAKEVAQIGAAIGREFSHALLAAVVLKPEAELQSALDRIVAAGLLFQQGVPPHATYLFKHVLVQDAAYGTLLREPRRALHARIAETLERQFVDNAESQPELLARHCTEAGLIEKAAALWGKAGQRSLQRSALVEAVAQFKRTLGLLGTLPGSAAVRREQIKIRIGLVNAVMHAHGHGARETKEALDQARLSIERVEALGEPLDDPLALFSVLYGFWVANLVAFDGSVIRDLSAQFLALAEKQRAVVPRMVGHRILASSLLYTGEIVEARDHYDRAIALYNPAEHRSLATRFGQDIRVAILTFRCLAQWILGYPDQALTDADRAIKEAHDIGHAVTAMFALANAAKCKLYCGKYAAAQVLVDELISTADETGGWFWKVGGLATRGWFFEFTGKPRDAIEVSSSAIAAWRAMGSKVSIPSLMANLAKAHADLNEFDEAWRCVGEAISTIETTRETWEEAEVDRLAGEIALMSREPDTAKAEVYFERALTVARQQQAKSWELRAAMSLARLWRDQGKPQQARDLLAPVYGWFTEGFDTLDLKEAKALLDELA